MVPLVAPKPQHNLASLKHILRVVVSSLIGVASGTGKEMGWALFIGEEDAKVVWHWIQKVKESLI
jgi:hypothetical protein